MIQHFQQVLPFQSCSKRINMPCTQLPNHSSSHGCSARCAASRRPGPSCWHCESAPCATTALARAAISARSSGALRRSGSFSCRRLCCGRGGKGPGACTGVRGSRICSCGGGGRCDITGWPLHAPSPARSHSSAREASIEAPAEGRWRVSVAAAAAVAPAVGDDAAAVAPARGTAPVPGVSRGAGQHCASLARRPLDRSQRSQAMSVGQLLRFTSKATSAGARCTYLSLCSKKGKRVSAVRGMGQERGRTVCLPPAQCCVCWSARQLAHACVRAAPIARPPVSRLPMRPIIPCLH